MGIYTAPGVLAYKVNGNKLNTLLTLSAGTYNSVVQEWDNCGGSSTAPVVIHVGGGGPTGSPASFPTFSRCPARPGMHFSRLSTTSAIPAAPAVRRPLVNDARDFLSFAIRKGGPHGYRKINRLLRRTME